jgi:DNA-binding beta-propeller fold protein YncE
MTVATLPPLPTSLQWLNTVAPPELAQRGRLTAVAFVNVGSTWSIQRLHDLQLLCARHPQRLRALAVHVPRFDHEREGRRVLKRVHRLGIRMPLALDTDWVAWQRLGLRAWPTVLLVDGAGQVVARIEGDGPPAELDAPVQAFLETAPSMLEEDETPAPGRVREPESPLLFPVGLAVNDQYLYIADSGHNRVLECTHGGRIIRQFGTGDEGFMDGNVGLGAFRRPHGLALLREMLYVADTGNHAIRRINLRSGDIDTLCGSGRRGAPKEGPVQDPRSVSLDTPRAVAVTADHLHIALAGDNRIWTFELGRAQLTFRAGSGELAVRDGIGAMAAFAQPVALAGVQQKLYVCDAAGSAIRAMQLRENSVQTLVGQGAWEFGHADGARAIAQLQEPQAIALDPDAPLLWIADSGNDRLRSLRLGGGELSSHLLPQPLHGPAGLAVGAGAVWIADTDAHAVLRVEPKTGAMLLVPIGE